MAWSITPLSKSHRAIVVIEESGWKPVGTVFSGVLTGRATVGLPSGEVLHHWLMNLDYIILEDGQPCRVLAVKERHVGSLIRPERLRGVAVNVSTVFGLEESTEPSYKFVAIGLLTRLKTTRRWPLFFPDR
jgi:hypothetical protein